VQNEVGLRQTFGVRLANVPVLARQCSRLDVGECLDKRAAELPPGPGYDDLAEVALSRSDRVGDWVLQTCLTRGSSHGTSCSSGSSGSYSSVTW